MVTTRWMLVGLVAAALAVSGCGGSDSALPEPEPTDTSTDDTSSVDGSDTSTPPDSGDTATPPDGTDASETPVPCDPPKKICGSGAGVCVDTSSDNANCGDCGKACATDQVCTAGVCGCATGTLQPTAPPAQPNRNRRPRPETFNALVLTRMY